jgi:hypothetical protein
MAGDMDVICAKREGKYFFGKDWTGSISLIGNDKFAVRRKAEKAGWESKPSFPGMRSASPE